MMIPPLILVLAAAGVCANPAIARSTTALRIVDLGYAKYQTDVSLEDGVTSFLGIRFGAPPTGSMRWRPPQKPSRISGIQNATTQPDQCFQAAIGLAPANPVKGRSLERRDVGASEDCLFLNVHVPSDVGVGAGLPVVVWIHPGGYDAGSNDLFPAQDFVKESNYGVIAVGFQYRLGVFGFLPGREVKEKGVLNAGLLDQQFALSWVQDHIASFGGDPSKVAIWGSSAGAGSVLQHIVAHRGHSKPPPLFRAAIMNSPFLPFQYNYNDEIPQALYAKVVAHVNCTHSGDTMACLRSADVSLLSAANIAITVNSFVGTYSFVPVVDETFITERPTETLKRGRINGDTLLVTTTSNEGALFVNETVLGPVNYTLPQYVAQLFPRLDQVQIQQVVDIYADDGATALQQAAAVMGDSIITCPAYYALGAFGERGWKGEFAIPPGGHGTDLSYEFTNFIIPATYNNTDFQHAFSQSFLSFAISLTPNAHFDPSNITPEWKNWSSDRAEMLFNKTVTGSPDVRPIITDAELLKRCQYWESVAAVNAQ